MKVTLDITQIITAKDENGNEQRHAYQSAKDAFEPSFLRKLLEQEKSQRVRRKQHEAKNYR